MVNEANDMWKPRMSKDEAKKQKDLEEGGKAMFSTALPFLEAALYENPSDKETLRSLRDIYARVGMDDKMLAVSGVLNGQLEPSNDLGTKLAMSQYEKFKKIFEAEMEKLRSEELPKARQQAGPKEANASEEPVRSNPTEGSKMKPEARQQAGPKEANASEEPVRSKPTKRSKMNQAEENILFRSAAIDGIQISNIAVLGIEGKDCSGQEVDGQSAASIAEGELLGIYSVVDRKHLELILKEQQLSMSGLVMEENALAKAGCLAGAQGTVIVQYGCLENNETVQVKLIDCTSSNMYWMATGMNTSLMDVMNRVRKELD